MKKELRNLVDSDDSYDIWKESNPFRTWVSGACSPTVIYAMVGGAFLGNLLWDLIFDRAAITNGESLALLGLMFGLAAWHSAIMSEVRTFRRTDTSNDALAYWRKRAFQEMGRHPEAIKACQKAIAINPDDAMTYRRMGFAYYCLERNAEAIDAYKKAIAIEPNYAWSYAVMAHAYEGLKRYAEAIAAYEQYFRLEPTSPQADSLRKELARLRGLTGE